MFVCMVFNAYFNKCPVILRRLLCKLPVLLTINLSRHQRLSPKRQGGKAIIVMFQAYSYIMVIIWLKLFSWFKPVYIHVHHKSDIHKHVLIDCLGLNAVFNNLSYISRRPVRLLMHFLAFSYQYSTQHTFRATCFFSTYTVSPLVEDE